MPLKPYLESPKDSNEYCAIPEHRPPACFGCEKILSLSKLRLLRNCKGKIFNKKGAGR